MREATLRRRSAAGRRGRRAWRRSRRGQVAAIATLLGLMLFVTMLANFFATQLPAQMRVNDANRALTVENQFAALSAAMRGVAQADALGGLLTQPVSLGSAPDPPFAPADGGSIGPGAAGAGINITYHVTDGSGSLTIVDAAGVGASLLVNLRNTYIPNAVVAFDQASVIYAQRGGIPVVITRPLLNYSSSGTLKVFVPQFEGALGSEAGTGTAELSVRLDAVQNTVLPLDGATLTTGSSTVLTITSRFAAGWYSYLQSDPHLEPYTTCKMANGSACTGPFSFTGPLGKVTVTVPATGLELQIATFTVSLF